MLGHPTEAKPLGLRQCRPGGGERVGRAAGLSAAAVAQQHSGALHLRPCGPQLSSC